jgi:tripartite-type tricarboxylate transporter receptor subunit TctC
VGAPPGTPPDIQAVLSNALGKALADPKVVAWAKENDVIMNPKTPEQAAALVARQRTFFEQWKKYLVTG